MARNTTSAPKAQAPKGAKLDAFAGLTSQSGAEPIPFGTYNLATDAEGRPDLLNGTYGPDGNAVADKYEGEAAEAGGYAGRPRTVFAFAQDANGTEYRLKIGSLFAAIKAAGLQDEFTDENGYLVTTGLEFQQTATSEYNGRPVYTVQLEETI